MSINVDKNQTALAIPPLFRLAFRPLFLAGTLFSVIAIGWWIHFWLKPFAWMAYGGLIWWHGHEMLFGFGIAIVTGFLLTAVKTWTGVPGIRGSWLASLFSIWLLGRLFISFSFGLDQALIMAVDVSYLIFSAMAMAYPIIKVKQWRNLMFIPILLLLALLNTLSHWAVISNQADLGISSLHATIMVFVLIISILGGRVIPAFTSNGAGYPKKQPIFGLEFTSVISILSMVVVAFIGFNQIEPSLLLILSVVALVSNSLRFARWGIQHTKDIPLLWSLHLAYLFIPIGFLMLLLFSLDITDNLSAVLHCFTVGAMGGMILAMISRVTLGHTGRPLKPHRFMSIGFVLILFSGLVRFFFPALLPQYYNLSIAIAGSFWILAFLLYIYFYFKMLVTARADGQPG